MKNLIIMLIIISPHLYAGTFPEDNVSSLKGVDTFDAKVLISTFFRLEEDRANFRENSQTQFELSLRRDGIIVDTAATNYLFCRLNVAQIDQSIVYTWGIEYWKWVSEGLNTLLYQNGGIVTLGKGVFSPKAAIEECADSFANSWLTQNPK